MLLRGGSVWFQGSPARDLARQFGTPLFVYDADRIRENYQRLDAVFGGYPRHQIYYSMKANPSLAVAAHLRKLGARADAASTEEVRFAVQAGFAPSEISLTGCCFSDEELEFVARSSVDFNADALGQLLRYGALNPTRRKVGLRLNPGVGADPLDICIGGGPESKFGIQLATLAAAVESARSHGLEVCGLHFHIGSGNLSPEPFHKALDATLAAMPPDLDLEYLNIGGGFGIPYAPWLEELDVESLADGVTSRLRCMRGNADGHIELRLEPGEYLVGDAGYLLARVQEIKRVEDGRPEQPRWRHFAITDTSSNHLLGAGVYGTHFAMTVDGRANDASEDLYDVVGNLNQSQDRLACDRPLPRLHRGDLLVVGTAGAYASARASRFNGRLHPAEVMLLDGQVHLVRQRESVEELWRGQRIPFSLQCPGGDTVGDGVPIRTVGRWTASGHPAEPNSDIAGPPQLAP